MLKGRDIHLRMVREADLPVLYELQQDIEARGNHFPLALRSESQMRKRFAEGGYWSEDFKSLLIVENETQRIVGTIMAFKPVHYHDSIEFGYILHDTTARGKGYMPAAVLLFAGYIFRLLNIYRVQLQIEPENTASQRVAAKAGFTHEGRQRQALIVEGRPRDLDMYSITREEWELSASAQT